MTLAHSLDRTVVIRATPETVFRYFTDTARWAAWWGAGSTIDPRPGGRVFIRYPDGTEALGEVVELARPERFVFTYGFASGQPIPPGSSRVAIHLLADSAGTRLTLRHDLDNAAVRDEHIQGWRYQLSMFANAVANEIYANIGEAADRWYAAWAIADSAERRSALAAIAAPTVQFRDRFSAIEGLDDLVPHIGAAQRFMPGMSLRRQGEIRQCQGTAISSWTAVASDGQPRGAGTSVFVFGPDGKIVAVTGFWA
jgi:uncharacterized protein YndB with AHSA1/START domain